MTDRTISWNIRPANRDDAGALDELFVRVFGQDRGPEHHRWKFEENPAGDPVIAVAVHGEAIVGQYALWPVHLRLGRDVVLGAQSLDTMTHPDYRGQGMFTKLAIEAMRLARNRGVEVLYGFPNDQSYPGFVNRLNWDHTGDVPVLTRVLTPSRHPRVPPWAAKSADALAAFLPVGRAGDLEVTTSRTAPTGLPEFLDTMPHKSGITLQHDQTFLLWRFAPSAGRQYEWVAARRGERLVAIAVWGRQGATEAVLSYLQGVDHESRAAVLRGALLAARAAGMLALRTLCQDDLAAAALRRAGFLATARLPLIVRGLTDTVRDANIHTHAEWRLFGADADTM